MAEQVVVIGQGYVGLPLAIRAVEVGYNVVGIDLDSRRVKQLSTGTSYVEDVPAERLRVALDSDHFFQQRSRGGGVITAKKLTNGIQRQIAGEVEYRVIEKVGDKLFHRLASVGTIDQKEC